MSTPSDDRPTRVLPQTAAEPAVSTAPATRRSRVLSHVPARLGRARTSTVVIGCLFVLLLALNSALPRDEGASVPVVLPSGQTAYVNESDLPSGAVPATTAPAPATTSAPVPTSRAPQTSADDEPTTSPTTRSPSSSPTTSRAPSSTSRTPSTSADPSASEEPTGTSSAPTS